MSNQQNDAEQFAVDCHKEEVEDELFLMHTSHYEAWNGLSATPRFTCERRKEENLQNVPRRIGQGTTVDINHKNGEFYYIGKNEADNERES